jgi:hypothetical protein
VVQVGHRTQVVTVTRGVAVGQVITEQDLGEASVALDPVVKAVRAEEVASVVGRRAAVGLRPGSLLAPSQVTKGFLVRAGEQVVPVGLKPEQVPATALVPGLRVKLVRVPAPGATDADTDGALDGRPRTVEGRVVKASKAATGTGSIVVDVAVSADEGPRAAAWGAAGLLRLVLEAPGGVR